MKKIQYPNNKKYETDYLKAFGTQGLKSIQDDWINARIKYPEQLGLFESDIKKILILDYDGLIDIYNSYMLLSESDREKMKTDLDKTFNYDKWESVIAKYFVDHSKDFGISTCFYCDTAYINSYETNPKEDVKFFLNSSTKEAITNKLHIKADKVNNILDHWSYTDLEEFNRLAKDYGCHTDHKIESAFKKELDIKERHQFDLDHALPKSECALVALSLYNFIPSCPVCNERLKRTYILGRKGSPSNKLSPSSKHFDVMDKIDFNILPITKTVWINPEEHDNDYVLRLDTHDDPDYEYYVQLFKLRERYNYHKRFALFWLGMKRKYPDTNIRMMSKIWAESFPLPS